MRQKNAHLDGDVFTHLHVDCAFISDLNFFLFYQDWYQERNDGIGTLLMSTPVDRPLTDFRQRIKPTCSLAEGPV